MSNGYVYIASNNAGGVRGTNYVNESVFSAKSLKAIHPHPTMSEAVMEAVAAAYDEVIHL